MARLVTDLLDLARADADTLPVALTLVDAAGIAEQCLDALTPLAGGRTVTRRLTPAQIAADPARLRQALTALVDNAFRHTRADSRVEITVEPTPGYLSIRVADDGDGIPDAQKSRVFDRFYRLDTARSRAQGGCGLGLSIAREITERMNGQILLTDNVPTGCVFELRFPVAHGGHG